MYALVSDIESYGSFLPWCGGARIVAREPDSVTAAIDIAYHGVNKTFTTRNRLVPGRAMELQLVDGPFKTLQGDWRFDALEDRASKVSLDLKFEFSNPVLGLVADPVFSNLGAAAPAATVTVTHGSASLSVIVSASGRVVVGR